MTMPLSMALSLKSALMYGSATDMAVRSTNDTIDVINRIARILWRYFIRNGSFIVPRKRVRATATTPALRLPYTTIDLKPEARGHQLGDWPS